MAVIYECDACAEHFRHVDDEPRPLIDVRGVTPYENGRMVWSFSLCPECAKVITDATQVKTLIRQVRAQQAHTDDDSQARLAQQAACEHQWHYGVHHKDCTMCGLQVTKD